MRNRPHANRYRACFREGQLHRVLLIIGTELSGNTASAWSQTL
jgi:hypothetical protein